MPSVVKLLLFLHHVFVKSMIIIYILLFTSINFS